MPFDLEHVKQRTAGFPLIEGYLVPLMQQRLNFPEAELSPLGEFLESSDSQHLADVECQLQRGGRVHDFGVIFEECLGSNPPPDEKIFDMLAEVRAAELLTEYFDDVFKVSPPRVATPPPTCDFIARRESDRVPAEVKDLGGEDFKKMKPIAPNLGYGLSDESADQGRTNEDVLQGALLARVRSGERQIRSQQEQDSSLGPGLVILVDRRLESWLFTGARDRTFEQLSTHVDSRIVRCVVVTTQAGPEFEVFPRDEYGWLVRAGG